MEKLLNTLGIEIGKSKVEKERERALKIQRRAMNSAQRDHTDRINALYISRKALQDGGMFTVPDNRSLDTYPKGMDELHARMAEAHKMCDEGKSLLNNNADDSFSFFEYQPLEEFSSINIKQRQQIKGVDNKDYNQCMECKCENGTCECRVCENMEDSKNNADKDTINASQEISDITIKNNKVVEEFVSVFNMEFKTSSILHFLFIVSVIYISWLFIYTPHSKRISRK